METVLLANYEIVNWYSAALVCRESIKLAVTNLFILPRGLKMKRVILPYIIPKIKDRLGSSLLGTKSIELNPARNFVIPSRQQVNVVF